jgi:hypothetical protein
VQLDIVIEGSSAQVADKIALERLAPLWKHKWDGRWKLEALDGGFSNGPGELSRVFTVTPVKIDAHAKGDPFGQITHRFQRRVP